MTLTDDEAGIEVHIGTSEREPDKTNVVIFGRSAEVVQAVISDLEKEYSRLDFIGPSFSSETNRWTAMGRVW